MIDSLFATQGAPTLAESPSLMSSSAKHDQIQNGQGRSPAQPIHAENLSLEKHIGSVLILKEDGTVLYGTQSLCDRLKDCGELQDDAASIPQEIELICQVLKQCRGQFPSQNWAIEFDIFTKDAIALRIRSRWLKLDGFEQPCILLVVEDRQQMVQDIVLDEAQDWGLTPREQEVWLLHQDGCTYSQIAEKLFISMNTVKKHMRSIYAKRRANDD